MSATSHVTRLFSRFPIQGRIRFSSRWVAAALVAAISGAAQAGTLSLAADYRESLEVTEDTTVEVARNFAAMVGGPLTGDRTLTLKGGFATTASSLLSLIHNEGNTFSGDIVLDVNGGTLKLAGDSYAVGPAAPGVVLPNMTAGNTLTVRRGALLLLDDNALGNGTGYAPDRLGSAGNRPGLILAGGTFRVNGPNAAALESTQSAGILTLAAGASTIDVVRNQAAATPKAIFDRLVRNAGAFVNFTGTSLGTAATGAAQILFNMPPVSVGGGGAPGTTTMSIVPGARSGTELVVNGANGIRPLAATEYLNTTGANDINAAGDTANVKLTGGTTPFTPLSAGKTIHSLVVNNGVNSTWELGAANKLTLISGQLIGACRSYSLWIKSGSLTAGSGADTDLDMTILQSTYTIGATIDDNGAGKITLVKNGGGALSLSNNGTNNTYSGGTFVNEGSLASGATANRRYLGTGPVRVDNAVLTLGAAGATANATGDDYTAVNGGQIAIATTAYAAGDTFNIGPGSILSGSAGLGTGLNSLNRGIGGASAVTNIVLAEDAIIGHPALTTGALNMAVGTIKNLGTAADLYYGLQAAQADTRGSVTIGAGTPFKGISTLRGAQSWTLGTIQVAAGTGSIHLQGLGVPGVAPYTLTLGNGATANGPVIALAEAGTVDAKIVGAVTLGDEGAVYGDTGAGKLVRFVVTPGATLTVSRPGGLGSGAGIASVVVQRGGTLAIGVPDALNGSVTVEAGGRLVANQAGGLTGAGALTLKTGSIVEIVTAATGFSGTQAAAAAIEPAVIVRLGVASIGSPALPLDTFFANQSPIYELRGASIWPVNPDAANTPILTLNKSDGGSGGLLVNDLASRSITAVANGKIVIGPNGGAIAATANTSLTIPQAIELGAGALTIGSAAAVDGLPSKLGVVYLTAAQGVNTALPGSRITVAPDATLGNGATPNALPEAADVTVNGALLVGASQAIGSLSGNGQVNMPAAASILTVGGNDASTAFSGVLSGGGSLLKTGAGRLALASANAFTGRTSISNGAVVLANRLAAQNSVVNNLADGGLAFAGGASFTIGALTGEGGFALTNSAGQAVALTVGNTSVTAACTGVVSGPGSLVKIGTGTQILSAAQYTGDTRVGDGVLRFDAASGFSSFGDVILESPGTLHLNYAGVNHIRYLYVDGVKQFGGIYGAADFPHHMLGTGFLQVDSAPELLCKIAIDSATVEKDHATWYTALVSGTDTNIISYAWDFDDDGSIDAHGPSVSRVCTANGAYTVRLIVTNASLETATAVRTDAIAIVPKYLSIKSWYTPGNTEGFTWGYDAFASFADAQAAGKFVPYWSEGIVEIVVPSNYPTLEAGIAAGVPYHPALGTNLQTTILIYSNTAPDSVDGSYTNAGWISGYRLPWEPKRGMIIRGVPKQAVTLRGGFWSQRGSLGSSYGDGVVLDGLRIEEGAFSFGAQSPTMITIYVSYGQERILTVRDCYFGPQEAGYCMKLDGDPVQAKGSLVIENSYFDRTCSIYPSYFTNVVVRGNFFNQVVVNLGRTFNTLVESNTFANGSVLEFAGSVPEAMDGRDNVYRVHNNNFISSMEGLVTVMTGPTYFTDHEWLENYVVDATNNWWDTIHGPYDSTNEYYGETLENTVEVNENSTDSAAYRTHRNMEPAGEFVCAIAASPYGGALGATNIMYVPWATNLLRVNVYTDGKDLTPFVAHVGLHYTADGPGESYFSGTDYRWGVNAFTNIQQAVDALIRGGTVRLAPETFEIVEPIVIGNRVAIVGTPEATLVAMKPGVESRCFFLDHAEASLAGLVISNGYAKAIGAGEGDGCGGGVYVAKSVQGEGFYKPALDGCTVIGCRADLHGGGVAFADNTSVRGGRMMHTRVTGNTAGGHGGGVYARNFLYLGWCTIDRNTASNGKGGGLCIEGDDVREHTYFNANYWYNADHYSQYTVISNNVAQYDGGGAFFATRTWRINIFAWADVNGSHPEYRNWSIDHIIPNWTFTGNRSIAGSGGGAYAACPNRRSTHEEGLTFFGCTFRNNEAGDRGGGLYSSTGRVDGCTFANNEAANQGGGAYIDGLQELADAYANTLGENPAPWMFVGSKQEPVDGKPWINHRMGGISRCSFDGNRSGNGGGGGIYVTGSGFNARTSVWGITNLVNNTAGNGSGGGICMVDSKLTLRFMDGLQAASNNAADVHGGAICASNAVLTDCAFAANQAGSGGALALAKGLLDRCTISGNTATDKGGGVFLTDGAVIRNSLVLENTAAVSGGGLYLAVSDAAAPLPTNESCTVVLNTAPAGSGIAMENGLIRNSVLGLNEPQAQTWQVAGGTVEYSCAPVASGASGEGNIVSDPGFANAGKRDFRLATNSPCLDRGTNQAWMAAATDLAGMQRILGTSVDMGAYEGGTSTAGEEPAPLRDGAIGKPPAGTSGGASATNDPAAGDAFANVPDSSPDVSDDALTAPEVLPPKTIGADNFTARWNWGEGGAPEGQLSVEREVNGFPEFVPDYEARYVLNGTECQVHNLLPGRDYWYRIRRLRPDGTEGPWSGRMKVKTGKGMPVFDRLLSDVPVAKGITQAFAVADLVGGNGVLTVKSSDAKAVGAEVADGVLRLHYRWQDADTARITLTVKHAPTGFKTAYGVTVRRAGGRVAVVGTTALTNAGMRVAQDVTLENRTGEMVYGIRLRAQGLGKAAWLINRTGLDPVSQAAILEIPCVLPAGSRLVVRLVYRNAYREQAKTDPVAYRAWPIMTPVHAAMPLTGELTKGQQRWYDGLSLLDLPANCNRLYTVYHSDDDGATWTLSVPMVRATANDLLWLDADEGAPAGRLYKVMDSGL